jgi:hypothetical protein
VASDYAGGVRGKRRRRKKERKKERICVRGRLAYAGTSEVRELQIRDGDGARIGRIRRIGRPERSRMQRKNLKEKRNEEEE